MTMDKQDQSTDSSELLDMTLARAIRDMDREIQPTRDLWPGIERKIANYPQQSGNSWMMKFVPYGVAASLVLAASSLVISLTQMNAPQEVRYATLANSLGEMQSEYLSVRNPSVKQFEATNEGLDVETINLLRKNLKIIETARHEIEMALLENPGNQRLIDMLMRVQQQELDLLNESYVEGDSSI